MELEKIEDSLGFYERKLSKSEKLNRKMIRRSIVAKSFINKNKKIIETDIKYARPGTGIPTSEYKKNDWKNSKS